MIILHKTQKCKILKNDCLLCYSKTLCPPTPRGTLFDPFWPPFFMLNLMLPLLMLSLCQCYSFNDNFFEVDVPVVDVSYFPQVFEMFNQGYRKSITADCFLTSFQLFFIINPSETFKFSYYSGLFCTFIPTFREK